MLTAERLREVLEYNPKTGIFVWRFSRPGVIAGQRTGSYKDCGYRRIKIDNVAYREARLAWLYVYGVWPTPTVDHINRIRDDNRICNLREATFSEQAQNQKIPHRVLDSGIVGVTIDFRKARNKYRVRAYVGKTRKSLGHYPSLEIARTVAQSYAVAI